MDKEESSEEDKEVGKEHRKSRILLYMHHRTGPLTNVVKTAVEHPGEMLQQGSEQLGKRGQPNERQSPPHQHEQQ